MIQTLDSKPLGAIRTFNYDEVESFREVRKPWGGFSNMSNAFPVEYQGIIYPTSEHLYISGLFWNNPEIRAAILKKSNPMYCKRRFRSKAFLPYARNDWHEVNVEWMKFVLNLKYAQNPEFRELLKSTGEKIILEDSSMHASENPDGGHPSFFWGAKDLDKRKVIRVACSELRKKLKAEGLLSKNQIKKRCKELKDKMYPKICGHYVGANVMGLLLTYLRDNGLFLCSLPEDMVAAKELHSLANIKLTA